MDYTDAEERQRIKKWWHSYGRFLLMAVIVGLLAGYGWRYYQSQEIHRVSAASLLYKQVVAFPSQSAKDKNSTAFTAAKEVIAKYPHTIYASMSYLWLAQNSVLDKKLSAAAGYLQIVIDKSKNNIVRQMARMRLARIFSAQAKYQQALQALSVVDDKSYLPMINTTRGDIYFANKNLAKAKAAYIEAKKAYAADGIEDKLLLHKIAHMALQNKTTTKK